MCLSSTSYIDVLPFYDFLDNYDKYNKYPVDLLQEALRKSSIFPSYEDRHKSFLYNIGAISKERAEKKIAEEKRIAAQKKAEEEEAAEWARLSKKYPGKTLLRIPYSYIWVVSQQTHNGTLIEQGFSFGRPRTIYLFIVRNNSDSSIPRGHEFPGGIFEPTGGLYQYITPRGTVRMVEKYKRLE